MTTKKRVSFISAMAFFSASFSQVIVAHDLQCMARIVAGPYLQAPTGNSMTVMWLTDKKCTSWVEYGTDKEHLEQTAYSSRDGLINAYIKLHKIKITGLKPGKTYYYRAKFEEILQYGPYFNKTFTLPKVSKTYSFTTCSAKRDGASIICISDTHESNEILTGLLRVASDAPYQTVFLNGDNLNYLHSEEQIIDLLLDPCCKMFATDIPFCYARGNHEARGSFARQLSDYLDTPGSANYYYAFTDGPVHFVVLDTGEDKVDSHEVYGNMNVFDEYRTRQAQWLKRHVETEEFKKAPWRVVMTHIPLVFPGRGHGASDCVEKLTPYLNGRIDLNIAGHTHRYRIVEAGGEQAFPVVIGGGKENATVLRLDATRTTIEVIARNTAGEVLGQFKLEK
jgi:predicted phosphodiesterase